MSLLATFDAAAAKPPMPGRATHAAAAVFGASQGVVSIEPFGPAVLSCRVEVLC